MALMFFRCDAGGAGGKREGSEMYAQHRLMKKTLGIEEKGRGQSAALD